MNNAVVRMRPEANPVLNPFQKGFLFGFGRSLSCCFCTATCRSDKRKASLRESTSLDLNSYAVSRWAIATLILSYLTALSNSASTTAVRFGFSFNV